MAFINKNNLSKISVAPIVLLKDFMKSDIKEGYVCVTKEENTRNIYIVGKGNTVNYIVGCEGENLYLVQPSKDEECVYLELNRYNERLEYANLSYDCSINLVFKTNLSSKDFNTPKKLINSIYSMYREICRYYPKESERIEMQ